MWFFPQKLIPPNHQPQQQPTAPAFLRPLRGIAALPELRQHLPLRQQLPHRAGALAVEVPAEPATRPGKPVGIWSTIIRIKY